jgi:hypothetical protein
MRPVPITDELLARFGEGAERRVFSSPSGDLTDPVIPPAEGVIYTIHPHGSPEDVTWPVTSVICVLEEGELEALNSGGKVVIGWPGIGMPVFMTPWVLT